MKYGVLSDIHGNLEAFESALEKLDQVGVQKYLFCGDLIGYGPDPEACVQKYTQLAEAGRVVGVMGNHDAIAVHPELQEYFHFDALQVLNWSIKQMSEKSLKQVSFLPEVFTEGDCTLVHGTPRDPLKEYFFNSLQYRTLYQDWKGQVLFVGHTHMPFYMVGDENFCHVQAVEEPSTVSLQSNLRYVINPGSVGKPRDNDGRASFGIWDSQQRTFTFFRKPYDVEKTQDKMKQAGFSALQIESLSLGL